MLGVEPVRDRLQCGLVEIARRHRDPDLEGLPEVAQVRRTREDVVGLGEALLRQGGRRPAREPGEDVVDLGGVEAVLERDVGLDVVVLDVDGQQAEGRDVARVRRDEHGRDAEDVHQPAQQKRPGAAEGGQGEVADVEAALDGDLAQRVGLVPRRDLEYAGGAGLGGESELPREGLDPGASGIHVERDLAAQQVRRDPAEHDVGVGDRHVGAALGVAERAGVGAGRLGADLEVALG